MELNDQPEFAEGDIVRLLNARGLRAATYKITRVDDLLARGARPMYYLVAHSADADGRRRGWYDAGELVATRAGRNRIIDEWIVAPTRWIFEAAARVREGERTVTDTGLTRAERIVDLMEAVAPGIAFARASLFDERAPMITLGPPDHDGCMTVDRDDACVVFVGGGATAYATIPGAYAYALRALALALDEADERGLRRYHALRGTAWPVNGAEASQEAG